MRVNAWYAGCKRKHKISAMERSYSMLKCEPNLLTDIVIMLAMQWGKQRACNRATYLNLGCTMFVRESARSI